jgi:uncharacterized protein (DUF433 family)
MNQLTGIEAIYEQGVLKPTKPINLKEKQVVTISINPTKTQTEHPYIDKISDVCGGRPIIKGTRIPVKVLVNHYQRNESVADILLGFPNLTIAQFYAAISYYYDHQNEIDTDIKADELSALMQKFNLEINSDGVLSPKS